MKKFLALLTAAAFFLGAFASAGLAATELKMATWWGGDAAAIFQQAIDAFIAKNPDVSIELMVWPWSEYPDKITTAFAANDTPDILMMDQTRDFQLYYHLGILEPLNSYMAAAGYTTDKWIPDTVVSHTYDGQIMGFPVHREQLTTWWNPGLFEQAGVAPLSDQPTWAEVWAAAEAIDNLGDDYYGLEFNGYNLLVYALDNGVSFVTEDGKADFTSPEMLALAEEFLGNFAKYAVFGTATVATPFVEGNVGMKIGDWFGGPNELGKHLDFETRITNFPVTDAATSQLAFSVTNSLGVASNSANKDLAFDFVSFFSTDECLDIYKDIVLVPYYGPAYDAAAAPKDVFPFNAVELLASKPGGKLFGMPQAPWLRPMVQKLGAELEAAVTGEITIEEYLEDLQYAVDDWFAVNQ